MDDLVSSDFLTYHTTNFILGHISVLVEICRSPLICMIILSYEIHTELMICFHFVLILQWSLSWVIQLGLCFLILSWFLDRVIPVIIILVEHMLDLLYIPMELFSSHQDRPDTLVSILGHIFVLVEICRSPLICMIILSYEIHIELMICFHFVPILQWSLSWVIQSGSCFLILLWFLDRVIPGIIISVEHMSDLFYIPIELFSSYQDRPDALVSILGHISLF